MNSLDTCSHNIPATEIYKKMLQMETSSRLERDEEGEEGNEERRSSKRQRQRSQSRQALSRNISANARNVDRDQDRNVSDTESDGGSSTGSDDSDKSFPYARTPMNSVVSLDGREEEDLMAEVDVGNRLPGTSHEEAAEMGGKEEEEENINSEGYWDEVGDKDSFGIGSVILRPQSDEIPLEEEGRNWTQKLLPNALLEIRKRPSSNNRQQTDDIPLSKVPIPPPPAILSVRSLPYNNPSSTSGTSSRHNHHHHKYYSRPSLLSHPSTSDSLQTSTARTSMHSSAPLLSSGTSMTTVTAGPKDGLEPDPPSEEWEERRGRRLSTTLEDGLPQIRDKSLRPTPNPLYPSPHPRPRPDPLPDPDLPPGISLQRLYASSLESLEIGVNVRKAKLEEEARQRESDRGRLEQLGYSQDLGRDYGFWGSFSVGFCNIGGVGRCSFLFSCGVRRGLGKLMGCGPGVTRTGLWDIYDLFIRWTQVRTLTITHTAHSRLNPQLQSPIRMILIMWPIAGLALTLITLSMGELASAYPVAGAMSSWTWTCARKGVGNERKWGWVMGGLVMGYHVGVVSV